MFKFFTIYFLMQVVYHALLKYPGKQSIFDVLVPQYFLSKGYRIKQTINM